MKRVFNYPITKKEAGLTITAYLKSLGYSRHIFTHLKKTTEGITVDGVWAYANHVLQEGEVLRVNLIEEEASQHIVPIPMELDICYEDEDLLIVNKAADTPIHPSINNYENTLANGVAYYFQSQGESFVYRCINRLDRDTTGLLIIAKHMLSGAILSNMAANRLIHREYLAAAWGMVPDFGLIDAPIGRKEGSAIERQIDPAGEQARTHYRRMAYANGCSLTALKLETGRTHQIRVHMKHLGYPLIGDYLYNPDFRLLDHQALHSYRLKFSHPITGKEMDFSMEPPWMEKLFPDFSLKKGYFDGIS